MLTFIKDCLSESDGTPSSKRLVYFMVILLGIFLCGFIIIKFGVINQLVSIFNSLMYSSAGTVGVGRAMENSSALNNFGNPGVPSPKISDVMLRKLIPNQPSIPKNDAEEEEEDLGILPKDS